MGIIIRYIGVAICGWVYGKRTLELCGKMPRCYPTENQCFKRRK